MFSSKKPLILALVAAFVTMFGCAEERDPRSYVQPHVMSKADFDGEWYYIPTVVDVPYSTTVTFIGETSMDVAIIYWDIQEKHIFARLAYDRIDGAETGTHEVWEGEIIGAWSISHFDIIRDYNATTGEEINVIRESTERPWYDREFIRIDWTKNLATNWSLFWPHYTKIDTVGFSQTDPSSEYYPKYVRDAEGALNYIGITDKVVMAPEMRNIDWDFYGLTQIPDCFFYGTTTSCNASTIIMRHAFWKKNPDNEYEVRKYEQTEMDRFGYFLTNVITYNRQYGQLIQEMRQYANRWNFYEESFQKADSATIAELYADDVNHTEVDGELFQCPGAGEPCRYLDDNTKVYIMGFVATSTADIPSDDKDAVHCPGGDAPCFFKDDGMTYVYKDTNWTDDAEHAQPVPLRYTERTMRPMIYYLNKTFPDDLWGLTESGEKTAEPAEGTAIRRTIDEWARAHNIWLDELGVQRNNLASVMVCPYVPKDTADADLPYAYGSNNTIRCERDIRRGDFRWPQINWVHEAQQSSPLGYGPPLPDPRTGESISVVANIYGEALDGYAAYQRDMVRALTDDSFPWSDYLTGDLQASWAKLFKHGTGQKDGKYVMPSKKMNWQRTGKTFSQDRIKRLFNNMDTSWAAGLAPEAPLDTKNGSKAFRQSLQKRIKALSTTGAYGDGTGVYTGYSKLNLLRDSVLEDRLMSTEMMLFAGNTIQEAGLSPLNTDPSLLAYGSEVRAKVSPLTTLNLRYIRAKDDLKALHRKNTVLYADVPFFDQFAYGAAKSMVDTYCGGTWDGDYGECAQKIYDVVRDETFYGVTIHEMGHNMGLRHNFKGTYDAMNFFDPYWTIRGQDGTMGPRTSDKITDYEIENRINDYAYTSIMDYNGNWNGDWMGLGKYDIAAINYAYGGLRQVFNTASNYPGIAAMQEFSEWSYPSPLKLYYTGAEAIHYTAFPSYADLSDGNRAWVPNAWIVTREMMGSDIKMTDAELDGGTGRFMVPFMFCSDEFRNLALGCNLFDQGADLYEITEYVIDMYERNYLLNNFSRGSYTWGWDEGYYQSRIVSRYFDLLQNHVQYYMLWLGIFYDNFQVLYGRKGIEDFFSDDVNGWGGWTMAVADIFSTFIRVLTMPQPGWFQQVTDDRGVDYYKFSTEDQTYCDGTGVGTECAFQVPLITGKFIDDSYDYDWGYEWYLKILRRGQFYDRPLAIQIIAEATNNWLGRDTQEDFRKYTMNFARIYPEQIAAVFAGIQDDNFSVIAPRVCRIDGTEPFVSHPYAADLRTSVAGRDQQCVQDMTDAEMPTPVVADAAYIDPNNTFSIQLYGATMGMALFPMNYSQSFIDRSRIYVKGNGEGIDWSHVDPADQVEFIDPFSNKVFVALKYPEVSIGGQMVDPSIGARMLDVANARLVIYNDAQAAYIAAGGDPDLAETEYNDFKAAERSLVNFIDNLEMVRGLTRTFEFAEFSAPSSK